MDERLGLKVETRKSGKDETRWVSRKEGSGDILDKRRLTLPEKIRMYDQETNSKFSVRFTVKEFYRKELLY